MERIRLSDSVTGAVCLLGDALLALAMSLLLMRPAGAGGGVVYPILCALLLVLLLFYTVTVFSSAITVMQKTRRVAVRFSLQRTEFDAAAAASVCTREAPMAQGVTRVISVRDAAGEELFFIPTMLNANSGVRSEIPAAALAAALGVAFVPTVDPALYDRRARREKGAAEREKQARARAMRRESRRRRRQGADPSAEAAKMPADVSPETDDGVNYDELDDRKGTDETQRLR